MNRMSDRKFSPSQPFMFQNPWNIGFTGNSVVLLTCVLRFNQHHLPSYVSLLNYFPSSLLHLHPLLAYLPIHHPDIIFISLQDLSAVLAHCSSLLGFCFSYSCLSVAMLESVTHTLILLFCSFSDRVDLPLAPYFPLFSPWNLVAIFQAPESLKKVCICVLWRMVGLGVKYDGTWIPHDTACSRDVSGSLWHKNNFQIL